MNCSGNFLYEKKKLKEPFVFAIEPWNSTNCQKGTHFSSLCSHFHLLREGSGQLRFCFGRCRSGDPGRSWACVFLFWVLEEKVSSRDFLYGQTDHCSLVLHPELHATAQFSLPHLSLKKETNLVLVLKRLLFQLCCFSKAPEPGEMEIFMQA